MTAQGYDQAIAWNSELRDWLKDLQRDTVLLALPGLYILSFVLISSRTRFAGPSVAFGSEPLCFRWC